jgi:hypothetical protein
VWSGAARGDHLVDRKLAGLQMLPGVAHVPGRRRAVRIDRPRTNAPTVIAFNSHLPCAEKARLSRRSHLSRVPVGARLVRQLSGGSQRRQGRQGAERPDRRVCAFPNGPVGRVRPPSWPSGRPRAGVVAHDSLSPKRSSGSRGSTAPDLGDGTVLRSRVRGGPRPSTPRPNSNSPAGRRSLRAERPIRLQRQAVGSRRPRGHRRDAGDLSLRQQ